MMPAESFLVFVNGVSVGRIAAQALNDIRAAAWRNAQVAFAQASNCLTAAMNLAVLVLFLPWSILGLVLTLLSVLDPTWVTGALAQMQCDLAAAVPRLVHTMLRISVAMAPLLLCFPGQLRRLGLRNYYQEHIDDEIRPRVRCPATGVVSLLDDRALTVPIEAAKVEQPEHHSSRIMTASSFADVVAGSWVARFRSLHDERPELGQVRDAYDGNLSIERFAPDGRSLGRHLAFAAGAGSDSAQDWEPIDPPDFQSLAMVFAYGKLLVRRRNSRTQASLALIRSNCHRPVA